MSRLILVADDDPLILRLVEDLLVHANHRVHCVANGRLAVEQIDLMKPDLILTDLDMPEMGGLELVRVVAKRHPRLPVVVVTGHGGEEEAVRCFRAGAADYVSKSKLREELVEVTERILNDREFNDVAGDSRAIDDNAKGDGGASVESEENVPAPEEMDATGNRASVKRPRTLEDDYIVRKRRPSDLVQNVGSPSTSEDHFKISPSRLQILRRQIVRLERWSDLVRSVKNNKRRHDRKTLGEIVFIAPIDDETGSPRFDQQRESFCKDVSASGCSLLHHLPLEGKRWMVLLAPRGPRPVSMECLVVRERRVVLGMYEIGLRFTKRQDGKKDEPPTDRRIEF